MHEELSKIGRKSVKVLQLQQQQANGVTGVVTMLGLEGEGTEEPRIVFEPAPLIEAPIDRATLASSPATGPPPRMMYSLFKSQAASVKPLLVFRLSLLVFRFFFTPPGVPVPFSPLPVFRFHFYPSGCSGVLSTPSPCSVWHHAPSWCSGRFSCPRDAPVGPLATLDPFDAPVVDAVIYALDTDPHAINFNGRSCYGVARVGQGPTSRRAARLRRTNWCAGMRRHRPAIASASHTPPRIFLMHCGALCRPSEMCCCSSPRALAGSSSPPVDQCPSGELFFVHLLVFGLRARQW